MGRRHALAAAAAALALTGCAGSSTQQVTPRSDGVTHRLGDTDTGSTVDVRVGDTVDVTLHSTYWTLADPGGGVLAVDSGPATASGGSGCPSVPGTGCGTVHAEYAVAQAGTVRLTAHRDSCGEALRCTAGQSDWTVTVRARG